MNATDNTPRKDPVVDAYRQASERDGARPGAHVRAAVLAHARTVAEAAATTKNNPRGVSASVLATPAANDRSPIWRLAAGIVLGLTAVWMYQLTRPGATGEEAAVATASAPVTTPVAESARAAATTTTVPAAPSAFPGTSAGAPAAAPAPAETAVAANLPAPPPQSAARGAAPAAKAPVAAAPAPIADASIARSRSFEPPAGIAAGSLREDTARSETSVALAKVASPEAKREAFPASPQVAIAPPAPAARTAPMTQPLPAPVAAAAPTMAAATTSSAAAAAANAASADRVETTVAIAEKSKFASRAAAEMRAAPSAAAPAATGPPAVAAAAPAPFPVGAAAAGAPGQRVGEMSAPMRQGMADVSMFSALRTGDLAGLRAAIARGANVNAKDERGQTALQTARARNDAELIKTLEAAGAK